MLTTILLILKIIGLVLLGILGLILLLLLLVLLVPLRYRAEGSYYETPNGKARVTWLLHLLSVTATYEKELDIRIRVFGICVNRLGGAQEAEASSPAGREADVGKKAETADVPKESTVEASAEKKISVEQETSVEQAQPKELSEKEQKTLTDQLTEDERRARETKRKKAEKTSDAADRQKRVGMTDKIRAKLDQISDKAEEIRAKLDEVLAFIKDEANQRTFRLVLRQLYRIIRHVLPTKIKGRVKFGFEDPFKTGQILTYVSPFYALYAKHLELIPVFEEPAMEGELWLKGRIRIGTVLAKAVRVLFDKNVWKLIKRFRKR